MKQEKFHYCVIFKKDPHYLLFTTKEEAEEAVVKYDDIYLVTLFSEKGLHELKPVVRLEDPDDDSSV